jgi:predicted O-linked N-acetylglucosamine transferase (SPINDLY family)
MSLIEQDYAHWLARGRAHQQAGRPIDAMGCYRRALKSNPYTVQAQLRLGEVLRDIGRHDEALGVWRSALALSPGHGGLLMSLATEARRAGANAEAIEGYHRVLAAKPEKWGARTGLALAKIALGDVEVYGELSVLLTDPKAAHIWAEIGQALATAPSNPARTSLLLDLAAARGPELPPLLIALAAKEMADTGEMVWARETLARAEPELAKITDGETLRLLALAAAGLDESGAWSERYAQHCARRVAGAAPMLWPRRSAGEETRLVWLVAPGAPIRIGEVAIDPIRYLQTIAAALPRERFASTVCLVADAAQDAPALESAGLRVSLLGAAPDPARARALAELDADVLIDLVGMTAPLGPLLAQHVARSQRTLAGLTAAHPAPLIDGSLPAPAGDDEAALALHRAALERSLLEGHAAETVPASARSAVELAELWRGAVALHQAGDAEAAIERYRELLADQPGYAPAHYLLGALFRSRNQLREAAQELKAAIDAAPGYVEARVNLVSLLREDGHVRAAATLCREGIAVAPDEPALWRALGLTSLAQHQARLARKAFRRALALAPMDAETHYNEGVALQSLNRLEQAARAYQRALVLDSRLIAADFNLGVIFRDIGQPEAAMKAFEQVLATDPRHVAAHKALAETLLAMRRIDDWHRAFDRFEAACPNALPLAVTALQVYQFRADFAQLERYLDRIQRDEFKAAGEAELVDCLEELLFLLLYFDFEPESLFGLYEAYDKATPRVYGRPMPRRTQRKPGKVRIGYLSNDLRNHVMGKMMYSAIERHDRERFEIFFYSLSATSDEWTERYQALSPHFTRLSSLSDWDAAKRIAADDLDILVDLGTHTLGARPGILARRPARVQITHVASAGVCGLSTIDYKLTDAFADLPDNQRTQIEKLLPMDGCVYPYRHIEPAKTHPFRRDELGIADDAIVIGAFINPLKLSRRCLGLWREILERVPNAVLAVSPMAPERRAVVGKLLTAMGIPHSRARILPQGRSEAENQARYSIVDFALDPMPYGGANGTLEALDMGVPVVTLVGRRHGERSSWSMLANLGATQTAASSGSQYVDIAVRLATDPAFMAEARGAIRTGLVRSKLIDMDAHTRALEQAYLRALEERFPAALAAAHDA